MAREYLKRANKINSARAHRANDVYRVDVRACVRHFDRFLSLPSDLHNANCSPECVCVSNLPPRECPLLLLSGAAGAAGASRQANAKRRIVTFQLIVCSRVGTVAVCHIYIVVLCLLLRVLRAVRCRRCCSASQWRRMCPRYSESGCDDP